MYRPSVLPALSRSTAASTRWWIFGTLLAFVVITAATLIFFFSTHQLSILIVQSIFGIYVPTCGCEGVFSLSRHPFLYSGLLLATCALVILLLRLAYSTFSIWLSSFLEQRTLTQSTIAIHHIQLFEQSATIHIIRTSSPVVCSAGIFKRRIFISADLYELLTTEERKAVLLHELAHARSFHVLQKWIALSLSTATTRFFAAPREIAAELEIAQEHEADAYVVARIGKKALLSAMLRIHDLQKGYKESQLFSYTASFGSRSGSLEARFQYLVDDSRTQADEQTIITPTFFSAVQRVTLATFAAAGLLAALSTTPALADQVYAAAGGIGATAGACVQEQEVVMSRGRAEEQSKNVLLQSVDSAGVIEQCVIPGLLFDPNSKINYLE